MPRFVILDHDHPFPHWDFMLEADGGLRTWRLTAEPAPGRQIPAEPLGVHRLAYLEYEGPVSGGRGRVARWDAGTYRLEVDEPRAIRVVLAGGRLSGRVDLTGSPDGSWVWRIGPGQGAGGASG
jgi:hypothetical protein